MNSAVSAKQDKLTFDSTPTSGSSNPVTSGGVYTAINGASKSNPIVILGAGVLFSKNLRITPESRSATYDGARISATMYSTGNLAEYAQGMIFINDGSISSQGTLPRMSNLSSVTANYRIPTSYFSEYLDALIGTVNNSYRCASSTDFIAECSITFGNSKKTFPLGRCSAKVQGVSYEVIEYSLYATSAGYVPMESSGTSMIDGDLRISIWGIK